MTIQELSDLGWEFDGEAPAQYGLRMKKKDPTLYKFIVPKATAEAWTSIHDIYEYISNYRYNQGHRDGRNGLVYEFRKLLHIEK